MAKNLLWNTKTYLVGHMENVSENEGQSWRDKVTDALSSRGIKVFNPYSKPFVVDVEEGPGVRERLNAARISGDFDYVAERMRQVRIFDLNLVDRSDFIIAKINPVVASWGSSEELVTAVRMKKPIFLAVDGGKSQCPLWIFGMFPHQFVFDSVDQIIERISKIDDGEILTDGRWRLLKKEFR